ncbi:MAG: hypothetical protein QM706_00720 [Nitrospira sp.]
MGPYRPIRAASLLTPIRRAICRLLLDSAQASPAEDDAAAMRLLRRMKSEAALLIALADIGGVWPVT